MSEPKQLSPQTARTDKDAVQLQRDNLSVGDWWILSDLKTVTITRQRVGELPTESITIPKTVFDKFVKFYITAQQPWGTK